jgi:methanogenic corrinoid protein MtbC1
MRSEIVDALAELEEDKVLELVKQELDAGTPADEILAACQEGMVKVGERFERAEYFVSDLMMAGEIFKEVGEVLGPSLTAGGVGTGGKVVVGTVKGDIHDIGKDIVVNMLMSANLEVTDLGVDVPAAQFVQALIETGAPVLGMSGLLTLAFDSMKETVDALEAQGLRDKVKVMIGGAPVDGEVCKFVGADEWGADAQAAVRLCKGWMEAKV